MKANMIDAIFSLVPNAQVIIAGVGANAVIEWVDPSEPPVTREQIDAEYERLLALPEPVIVPSISDRQFFQQAAVIGIISKSEALAAVQTGTIPTVLQSIVDAEPNTSNRFAMEMLLSGATVFDRRHPMTSAIGAALGITDQEIDQFFIDASSL